MIFIKLNQMKKPYHKGQVSIFFIAIIATLITYAFITVNVGKIAIYQTRSSNAADAGALAAAAVMAEAFNYMANENGSDAEGENGTESAKYGGAGTANIASARGFSAAGFSRMDQNAASILRNDTDILSQFQTIMGNACPVDLGQSKMTEKNIADNGARSSGGEQPLFGISNPTGSSHQLAATMTSKDNAEAFDKKRAEFQQIAQNNRDERNQTVLGTGDYGIIQGGGMMAMNLGPGGGEKGLSPYSDSSSEDSSGGESSSGQDGMYSLALYAGIMYNLYNALNPAGDELGRFNKRYYTRWLGQITPETVMSGKPETFVWVDGAGRIHVVMAMIETGCPNNSEDNVSQSDGPTSQDESNGGRMQYRAGKSSQETGTGNFLTGTIMICLEPIFRALGQGNSGSAKASNSSGSSEMSSAQANQKGTRKALHPTRGSSSQDVMHDTADIVHSRQVFSFSMQFHLGTPVKGMRGQVDEMTVYWPQISVSRAGFRGAGDIGSSQARHDAGLF